MEDMEPVQPEKQQPQLVFISQASIMTSILFLQQQGRDEGKATINDTLNIFYLWI